MVSEGLIRVALIQPNKFIRGGLEALLLNESKFKVTGSFSEFSEAYNSLIWKETDILLYDLSYAASDGFKSMRIFKTNHPEIIVVVTSSTDDDMNLDAVKNGVSGFVTKNLKSAEFIKSLLFISNGCSPVTPQLANQFLHLFKKNKNYTNIDSTFLLFEESTLLSKFAEGKSFSTVAEELSTTIEILGKDVRHIYNKIYKMSVLKRSIDTSFHTNRK